MRQPPTVAEFHRSFSCFERIILQGATHTRDRSRAVATVRDSATLTISAAEEIAMLRLPLAIILSLVVAAASATETPLVIHQPIGNLTAIINPSLGVVTLYEIQGNQLTRYSSVSFLNDLEFLEKYYVSETDGNPHSALRDGFNNNPTVKEWMASLPNTLSKKEAEKGMLPYRERAMNTEDEFWDTKNAESIKYDGVVRGAIGARMLFLVIPVKRAILVYEIASNKLTLSAYRNYGPELYTPQVWKSSPTPEQILKSLPEDVQEEHKKALAAQMEDPNFGADAQKIIPLDKKGDVWIGAGSASGFDRFAIIDFANKHIMSYEYSGKNLELKSVRNLEIDLLIPTGYNCAPDPKRLFEEFRADRERQAFMKEMGYEPDLPMLTEMVNSSAKTDNKTSPYQCNVRGEDITVDFLDHHKVFVYRLQGANNSLELVSARDYTVDVGIALFDNERNNMVHGRTIYAGIKNRVSAKQTTMAMLMLKSALNLNPGLYKEAEKDFKNDLAKQPEWKDLILKATEDYDAQQKQLQLRKDKAAEAREKKRPSGKSRK
jgi:hypothetical protein